MWFELLHCVKFSQQISPVWFGRIICKRKKNQLGQKFILLLCSIVVTSTRHVIPCGDFSSAIRKSILRLKNSCMFYYWHSNNNSNNNNSNNKCNHNKFILQLFIRHGWCNFSNHCSILLKLSRMSFNCCHKCHTGKTARLPSL